MRRTEKENAPGARPAAYAVSSDRLPHFQGLPIALTGHVACAVVSVGFPGVVRLAPETQVDSGARAALAPRMTASKFDAAGLVAGLRRGLLSSGLAGGAGLAFVDLSQERIERALDDRGGVAVRDLVGEQILELFELVARILAEGHLEAVSTR